MMRTGGGGEGAAAPAIGLLINGNTCHVSGDVFIVVSFRDN